MNDRTHSRFVPKILLVFLFTAMVWNAALAQSPVPEDAEVERLENGFQLSEGPFWHSDGYLLFSDVSGNKIYKWMVA